MTRHCNNMHLDMPVAILTCGLGQGMRMTRKGAHVTVTQTSSSGKSLLFNEKLVFHAFDVISSIEPFE